MSSRRTRRIRITSATRLSQADFGAGCLLGRSFERAVTVGKSVVPAEVSIEIAFENRIGLPVIYGDVLARADDDDLIVYVHDDVFLYDWNVLSRVVEALEVFDVVGVAGNVRRVARQPAWAFVELRERGFVWDDRANLSGAVAHEGPGGVTVSPFGPAPREVKLLDGVFLAARAGPLRRAGVTWDPTFSFHFYDLDFCRSCEAAGLRMGTFPIAIVHASGGAFGSPAWQDAYSKYLRKWEV